MYVCNYVCMITITNRHVRFCNSPNQRGALALQRHASQQAKKKCTAIPLTGKANNQSCTLAAMRMSANTCLTSKPLKPSHGSSRHLSHWSNMAGVSLGNTRLNDCTLTCKSNFCNLISRPCLRASSSTDGSGIRHGYIDAAGGVSLLNFLFNFLVVAIVKMGFSALASATTLRSSLLNQNGYEWSK